MFDSREMASDKTAPLYPPLPAHELVRVPPVIVWPKVKTLAPPPAPAPVPVSGHPQRMPRRPDAEIKGHLSRQIVSMMSKHPPETWWRIYSIKKGFDLIKPSNITARMVRLFELGWVERRALQLPVIYKGQHPYEYRLIPVLKAGS